MSGDMISASPSTSDSDLPDGLEQSSVCGDAIQEGSVQSQTTLDQASARGSTCMVGPSSLKGSDSVHKCCDPSQDGSSQLGLHVQAVFKDSSIASVPQGEKLASELNHLDMKALEEENVTVNQSGVDSHGSSGCDTCTCSGSQASGSCVHQVLPFSLGSTTVPNRSALETGPAVVASACSAGVPSSSLKIIAPDQSLWEFDSSQDHPDGHEDAGTVAGMELLGCSSGFAHQEPADIRQGVGEESTSDIDIDVLSDDDSTVDEDQQIIRKIVDEILDLICFQENVEVKKEKLGDSTATEVGNIKTPSGCQGRHRSRVKTEVEKRVEASMAQDQVKYEAWCSEVDTRRRNQLPRKAEPCRCELPPRENGSRHALSGKEHYHCSQCDLATGWANVVRHEATIHRLVRPGLATYTCPVCHYLVIHMSEYARHISSHYFGQHEKIDDAGKAFLKEELEKCLAHGVRIRQPHKSAFRKKRQLLDKEIDIYKKAKTKRLQLYSEDFQTLVKKMSQKKRKQAQRKPVVARLLAKKARQAFQKKAWAPERAGWHARKQTLPPGHSYSYEVTLRGATREDFRVCSKVHPPIVLESDGLAHCQKCSFKAAAGSLKRHYVARHHLRAACTFQCHLCAVFTTNKFDFMLHIETPKHKESVRVAQGRKDDISSEEASAAVGGGDNMIRPHKKASTVGHKKRSPKASIKKKPKKRLTRIKGKARTDREGKSAELASRTENLPPENRETAVNSKAGRKSSVALCEHEKDGQAEKAKLPSVVENLPLKRFAQCMPLTPAQFACIQLGKQLDGLQDTESGEESSVHERPVSPVTSSPGIPPTVSGLDFESDSDNPNVGSVENGTDVESGQTLVDKCNLLTAVGLVRKVLSPPATPSDLGQPYVKTENVAPDEGEFLCSIKREFVDLGPIDGERFPRHNEDDDSEASFPWLATLRTAHHVLPRTVEEWQSTHGKLKLWPTVRLYKNPKLEHIARQVLHTPGKIYVIPGTRGEDFVYLSKGSLHSLLPAVGRNGADRRNGLDASSKSPGAAVRSSEAGSGSSQKQPVSRRVAVKHVSKAASGKKLVKAAGRKKAAASSMAKARGKSAVGGMKKSIKKTGQNSPDAKGATGVSLPLPLKQSSKAVTKQVGKSEKSVGHASAVKRKATKLLGRKVLKLAASVFGKEKSDATETKKGGQSKAVRLSRSPTNSKGGAKGSRGRKSNMENKSSTASGRKKGNDTASRPKKKAHGTKSAAKETSIDAVARRAQESLSLPQDQQPLLPPAQQQSDGEMLPPSGMDADYLNLAPDSAEVAASGFQNAEAPPLLIHPITIEPAPSPEPEDPVGGPEEEPVEEPSVDSPTSPSKKRSQDEDLAVISVSLAKKKVKKEPENSYGQFRVTPYRQALQSTAAYAGQRGSSRRSTGWPATGREPLDKGYARNLVPGAYSGPERPGGHVQPQVVRYPTVAARPQGPQGQVQSAALPAYGPYRAQPESTSLGSAPNGLSHQPGYMQSRSHQPGYTQSQPLYMLPLRPQEGMAPPYASSLTTTQAMDPVASASMQRVQAPQILAQHGQFVGQAHRKELPQAFLPSAVAEQAGAGQVQLQATASQAEGPAAGQLQGLHGAPQPLQQNQAFHGRPQVSLPLSQHHQAQAQQTTQYAQSLPLQSQPQLPGQVAGPVAGQVAGQLSTSAVPTSAQMPVQNQMPPPPMQVQSATTPTPHLVVSSSAAVPSPNVTQAESSQQVQPGAPASSSAAATAADGGKRESNSQPANEDTSGEQNMQPLQSTSHNYSPSSSSAASSDRDFSIFNLKPGLSCHPQLHPRGLHMQALRQHARQHLMAQVRPRASPLKGLLPGTGRVTTIAVPTPRPTISINVEDDDIMIVDDPLVPKPKIITRRAPATPRKNSAQLAQTTPPKTPHRGRPNILSPPKSVERRSTPQKSPRSVAPPAGGIIDLTDEPAARKLVMPPGGTAGAQTSTAAATEQFVDLTDVPAEKNDSEQQPTGTASAELEAAAETTAAPSVQAVAPAAPEALSVPPDMFPGFRLKELENFSTTELWEELVRRRLLVQCACGQAFKNTTLFYIHRQAHNTDEPLRCGSCSNVAKTWGDFLSHLMDHNK